MELKDAEEGVARRAPPKRWYSAKELAGLPGMPATCSAVIRAAKRHLWANRKKRWGKGREYARTALPAETQRHLLGLGRNILNSLERREAALEKHRERQVNALKEAADLEAWMMAGEAPSEGPQRRGKRLVYETPSLDDERIDAAALELIGKLHGLSISVARQVLRRAEFWIDATQSVDVGVSEFQRAAEALRPAGSESV